MPALSRPHLVLVVDDDLEALDALQRLLQRPGRRVITAADPAAALALVDREPVDVIIGNADLPDIAGLTLLALLRLDHPEIVRILLTADASFDAEIEAINRGEVFRFLSQPCDEALIEDSVAAALSHRAERDRAAVVAKRVARRPQDDFLGRYQILRKLGEGGNGTVYRALNTQQQTLVAIKVLQVSAAHEPAAVARFVREARAASLPRHAGVVEVLDHGKLPDGRPFLVMELVEWPTLEQRMDGKALPPADALQIARGIASGLAAAHATGVIHRDLKPENVFVDDALAVKISDFGAAKLMDDLGPALTQEGCVLGTAYYMSPEHATLSPLDHRTDIYALGCVLYEMLAGEPPYDADSLRDILVKQITSAVPRPMSPYRALPPSVLALVRKAMSKRPADRQQSADELIAEIDHAMVALGGPAATRKTVPNHR